MVLTELFLYPIKSLGGISVAEAVVEARGLRHDRRWLLVDERGHFLTQRTFPQMALLAVALEADSLRVTHRQRPELGELRVPLTEPATAPVPVQIWDDTCAALPVSAAADAWFSATLERPARLVYMPDSTYRPVDPDYAPPGSVVSFADAFPYLLIGQASLDDLNQRLAAPVPMNRFRPNFVVSGGAPFAEDEWRNFTIGALAFRGVKPCARCVLTTVDQRTAEVGKEPLRTLARYRTRHHKVLFGQNVLAREAGVVRVGDEVTVTN